MLYSIGDKFLVQGIECEVKYVNNKKAWVAPIEDTEFENGKKLLKCITIEVLDEKGRDSKGNKAQVLNNSECQAV